MASNSEANLSSDFDIDEVINWDEQNYSSKDIEFQLPQLGLPSNVKTSQNTAVTLATSQEAQNSNAFYSALLEAANNSSIVQDSKSRGFSSGQDMVSPNGLSFPQNINIPPITSSNSSFLQYSPNLVGQNSSLAPQFCMTSMQNVQDTDNLMNDDVSFGEADDLIEGPLDRIVDQIMERQISEGMSDRTPLPSSFEDDTPIITYSNRQATNSQLSNSISPQNVPLRNVLSPNPPARNASSPNITMRNSPSPSAPTLQVSSPGNPPQNILSPNLTRNISEKVMSTNVSPPNVPSLQHSGNHSYMMVNEGMPPQTHSTFRLQSPISVATNPRVPAIVNMSIGQTKLSAANSFFQPGSVQNSNQSYPSFMLQNPTQTLIRQPSTTISSPSNVQSKPVWQENSSSLGNLLRLQNTIRASSPNLNQGAFTSQFARSSANYPGNEQSLTGANNDLHVNLNSSNPTNCSPVLANKIVSEQSDRDLHVIISSSTPATSLLQTVTNFPKSPVTTPLSVTESNELQMTPIGQNQTTQLLSSPGAQTSVNDFFVQNLPNVVQSAAVSNKNGNVFYASASQSQNGVSSAPNLSQVNRETTHQNNSVFTLVSSASTPSLVKPSTQATSPALFKTQGSSAASKPAGITTIKMTPNTSAGFQFPAAGFIPNSSPKAISFPPPRAQTIKLTSPTHSAFPAFKLTQTGFVSSSNAAYTKPMVFTLAAGGQATLKGLPASLKDKLNGRQVIFLQQPSGQPINTPKPQPMKIVFVNDASIKQVVTGPVKSEQQQISATPVVSQVSKVTQPFTESKPGLQTSSENIQDSDAGSPTSVNSADSESAALPSASLKQAGTSKRKGKESKDAAAEQKSRGKKRRRDPNRPVKPLSSFQRFFQAMQPTIRKQNPQAAFAEVSKTIKEMWEALVPKEKKVYQDAWRMERVQYKKAMEEYTAGLDAADTVDGTVTMETSDVEMKDEVPTTTPIAVSPVHGQTKTESPIILSSPSSTSSSVVVLSSSPPPPRSTGKPLAMMAEMAHKTKLASAHAAKGTVTTKSMHATKAKAINGIEDGGTQIAKKKTKINPIPRKVCVRSHCGKPSKQTKERGNMFCSNDCLRRYCRSMFQSWVETRRKVMLKAAT